MKSVPFISVIINTYNGAGTIARTIESFKSQDYPGDCFEIIVADDGSSDDTAEVAQAHGALVVRLPVNRGISAARNAGLGLAKGSIILATDDDCVALPDLLRQIAAGYQSPDIMGVGSFLIPSRQACTLVEDYMNETATGMESALVKPFGGNPLSRLWYYLVSKVKIPACLPESMVVDVLYGATGTFRADALRAVGGWDVSMSGIEDRDICMRLNHQFPDKRFVLRREARMLHDPDMTLMKYLLRPFQRGPRNLEFHQRYKLLPPVFPMPILAGVGFLAGASHHPLTALSCLVLMPQLLYFWWPLRAWHRRDAGLLLFTYVQLAEESMVILGLLRGYIRPFKRSYRAFAQSLSHNFIL